jgi:orotidine-5'-phosphate decarboxylase
MIHANKVIVALDYSSSFEAKKLLKSLKGHPVWIKVGMELYFNEGKEFIELLKDEGFSIFLDLKLHDIPNTVEKAIQALCKLPIGMINVHAAGGSEMMKRAAHAVKSSSTPPLLLAVTQLTSTTTEQMNREQGIPTSIRDSVISYAKLAKSSGCDGVVCSPLEVPFVKDVNGTLFLTVTPGIRPALGDHQDQKRVTTPKEAFELGTDFIVIGRPITGAPSPREALELILKGSL